MKRNMNVRFSDLSGGLFAETGKADVGEGADKFQKAGGDNMAWADMFYPDPWLPESVRDASIAVIEEGISSHYTLPVGLPRLREALAEHIREKLKSAGQPCTLVNGRFVKPMDTDVIDHLAGTHHTIVTLEENVLRGGYGERVTDYVQKHYPQIKVVNIALPDAYVEHGNVSVLRNELGIDSDSILAQLKREGVLETDAEA